MTFPSPPSNPTPARRTLLIALLITALSILCMFRFRTGSTIQALLNPRDPTVLAMDRLVRDFPVAEELLVLATLPPGGDKSQLLAFADRLERSVATGPDARAVISQIEHAPPPGLRNFIEKTVVPNGLYYLDDASFTQMLALLSPAGMSEQLTRARELLSAPGPAAGGLSNVLLKDPLRLHELLLRRASAFAPAFGNAAPTAEASYFSPGGQSLLVRVRATGSPSDLAFSDRLATTLARLIDAANTDHLQIRTTGAYLIAAHNARAIRQDSIDGSLFTFAGLAAVFLLLHHQPHRWFLLTFLPVTMGIAWGFGLYALVHPVLTPLAAVVGGALGGIGIDYCVFAYAHLRRRQTSAAQGTQLNPRRELLSPLSAAFGTSVIGFLAIAYSPVQILRDFAILGSIALLGAFIASITVLPAAFELFAGTLPTTNTPTPPPPESTARVTGVSPALRRTRRTPKSLWITQLLNRYRHHLLRRPLHILIPAITLFAALLLTLALAAKPPAPDADLTGLHPQPNPPLQNQREIADTMGVAPGSIQLLLSADTPTDLIGLSHEVERRLASPALAAAGYRGTLGVASFLPNSQVITPRRQAIAAAHLPDTIEQNFQSALRTAGFSPAPFARYSAFLRTFVTPPASPGLAELVSTPDIARLVLPRSATATALPTESVQLVFFSTPLDRRADRDAALTALHQALSNLPGITITGAAAIGQSIETTIYHDLPIVVLSAFFAIALYHIIHFRSLKIAAIALTPTLFSLAVLYAYMSFAHQPLNLVNMVMIPLLLGIDIDYGILTTSAYTQSTSRRDFLRRFPTTAHAVITCAACTTVGFGSLAFTSMPAVRSLGYLINIGVLSCLLGTLIFLWPILFLLKSPTPHPPAPSRS